MNMHHLVPCVQDLFIEGIDKWLSSVVIIILGLEIFVLCLLEIFASKFNMQHGYS